MNVPKTLIAVLAMSTVSTLLDCSFVNAPQDMNGMKIMNALVCDCSRILKFCMHDGMLLIQS